MFKFSVMINGVRRRRKNLKRRIEVVITVDSELWAFKDL